MFKRTSGMALSLASLLATASLAAPAQPSGQVQVRDHNISMAQVIEAQKA